VRSQRLWTPRHTGNSILPIPTIPAPALCDGRDANRPRRGFVVRGVMMRDGYGDIAPKVAIGRIVAAYDELSDLLERAAVPCPDLLIEYLGPTDRVHVY